MIDALIKDKIAFDLLITQGGFSPEDARDSYFSGQGQLPFNQELDREAALDVFNNFTGDIVAISSSQTRKDEVSYDNETSMIGWLTALQRLYAIHRNETITKPERKRPDGSPRFSSPHDVHLALLRAFWDNKNRIEERKQRNRPNIPGGEPLYTLEKKRERVEGRHGEYWVVSDLQGSRIKRLFGRVLSDPQLHS